MNRTKLLEVSDLCVSYGDTAVLRGVSFCAYEGEFIALLGLNGSGKTTLLKAMCALLKPVSGCCKVLDRRVDRLSFKKRAQIIAYMPQRSEQFYEMRTLDVVLMGCNSRLGFFETPGQAQREQALQILEKLEFGQYAQKKYHTLSEGQKQIAILARSLMQEAPVLLFDEPDAALDFNNRHMVLAKIRDLLHTESACGMITLHDPNFALAYCDRILLLSEGRIQEEIIPREMGRQEILKRLELLYRDIELVNHGGTWMMVHQS